MKKLTASAALLAIPATAYLLSLQTTEPTALLPVQPPPDSTTAVSTDNAPPPSDIEQPAAPPAPAPLSQARLDRRETEVVFGIEVLKDRNCDVREQYLDNGDGTVTRALSCEPREQRPGPYDHYSDETLAALAEDDWQAAYELGRRLIMRDPRRGTRYMLRAIALDPSPSDRPARLSPLWEVVNERFKTDAVIRGDQEAIMNMHLFYSLGERIDPDYAFYTAQSRQLLQDAGFSETAIAEIEARSALFLENMNDLRQERLGESLRWEERL